MEFGKEGAGGGVGGLAWGKGGLADHPSGSCGLGLRVEQETLIEMCLPWALLASYGILLRKIEIMCTI